MWAIERRLVGNGHDRTNTRRGHEPAADFVPADYVEERFVQLGELGEQRGPCRKHCCGNLLERLMPGNELADAPLEGAIRHLANLQSKTPENATNTEREVLELGLELLARDKQGTHFLGSDRLGMNRSEPSQTQQLSYAAGIPAIRLDPRGRQRLLDVARLHENRLKSCCDEPALQPL